VYGVAQRWAVLTYLRNGNLSRAHVRTHARTRARDSQIQKSIFGRLNASAQRTEALSKLKPTVHTAGEPQWP